MALSCISDLYKIWYTSSSICTPTLLRLTLNLTSSISVCPYSTHDKISFGWTVILKLKVDPVVEK